MPTPKPRKKLRPRGSTRAKGRGRWKRVKGSASRGVVRVTRSREKMDSDSARGFAPNPGDAGGSGAIRQSSVTLPMLIDQGGAMFSRRQRSAPLPLDRSAADPEMFLEHLWISEDQRFFQHEGFDWKEMDLAVKEAERKGKPVRGASTITNQCARSIFLWQGRSWIRKGLESYSRSGWRRCCRSGASWSCMQT